MSVDPWLNVDQVKLVCSSCAESMKKKGIKAIRASVLGGSKTTQREESLNEKDKGETMKREAWIAERIIAKYPETQPTEQERKLWREQAEERRRKEGIRPRKED